MHLPLSNNVADNRTWKSLLDIHHPYSWHASVAVTAVFSTPDDGRRKRRKCRVYLKLLIKTILPKVAFCWFFIYYRIMMHWKSNITFLFRCKLIWHIQIDWSSDLKIRYLCFILLYSKYYILYIYIYILRSNFCYFG